MEEEEEEEEGGELERPKSKTDHPYNFPFPPYETQLKLMDCLYSCLEDGNVGILSSPTGTGKSLSILCGCLSWILAQSDTSINDDESTLDDCKLKDDSELPSWMRDQSCKEEDHSEHSKSSDDEWIKTQRRNAVKEWAIRRGMGGDHSRWVSRSKKRRAQYPSNEDIESHNPSSLIRSISVKSASDWDRELDGLLYGGSGEPESKAESLIERLELNKRRRKWKLVYASRTHSQIQQFISELKNTVFDSELEVVHIGSRKQLCINGELRAKHPRIADLNQACIDLRRSKLSSQIEEPSSSVKVHHTSSRISGSKRSRAKAQISDESPSSSSSNTKSAHKCPYLPSSDSGDLQMFGLAATMQTHDIEETAAIGTSTEVCSYYGLRTALSRADVVCVPYASLIHHDTRESLGLEIDQYTILVVDEAHNLIESLNALYSTVIPFHDLKHLTESIELYLNKSERRLKRINSLKWNRLLSVLRKMIDKLMNTVVHNHSSKMIPDDYALPSDEFAIKMLGLEMNVLELADFIEDILKDSSGSIVSRIIIGEDKLRRLRSFFNGLASLDGDGCVIVSEQNKHLKYVQLNAGVHLSRMIKQCRSLVMCGGTMQPVSHFTQQINTNENGPKMKIRQVSCPHVIQQSQVKCVSLAKGPTGMEFQFTFQKRNDDGMLDELCRTLCTVAKLIQGGLVVFFPSFELLNCCVRRWKNTGDWMRIVKSKQQVWVEPRESVELESIFSAYSQSIEDCGQGCLLCVCNGKLSEGIDFKNELCRMVVLVGLPFANPNDVELGEKMRYLDSAIGKGAGQSYYTGLCMRSVNQSIGRAIRHRDDFGAILLVDSRFQTRSEISGSLPEWIQASLVHTPNFGQCVKHLVEFRKANFPTHSSTGGLS